MLTQGPLDVLTGDYLAELTMLILGRDRLKNPELGYAKTFLRQLEECLGLAHERGVRIVVNAGGLNPAGLAGAVRALAAKLSVPVSVAHVEGDDLMPYALPSGEGALTANAYLGGAGITACLRAGAGVVVTGRVTDAALVSGPAAWWFDWAPEDHDRLAGAVVAGHVLECGTQATGGNYAFFTRHDVSRPGFPLAEIAQDGSSVITKHPGTGGVVSVGTVTAQLLYETQGIRYLGPDVTARLDTVRLSDAGTDRVRISGVLGEAPPPTLKVGATRIGGWRNEVVFVLTGLDVDAKAALVREQLAALLAPVSSVAWTLSRTDHEDAETEETASALLRLVVRDPSPDRVGRALTSAAIELALSSYPGFHVTAPPTPAQPYGVFASTTIPATAVPHTAVLTDGIRLPIGLDGLPAGPHAPKTAEPGPGGPTAAAPPRHPAPPTPANAAPAKPASPSAPAAPGAEPGSGTPRSEPGLGTSGAEPGLGGPGALPGHGGWGAEPGSGTPRPEPGPAAADPGPAAPGTQPGPGTPGAEPDPATPGTQPGPGTPGSEPGPAGRVPSPPFPRSLGAAQTRTSAATAPSSPPPLSQAQPSEPGAPENPAPEPTPGTPGPEPILGTSGAEPDLGGPGAQPPVSGRGGVGESPAGPTTPDPHAPAAPDPYPPATPDPHAPAAPDPHPPATPDPHPPATPDPALPTRRVPLGTIVGARSGDKGGDANVGVWAETDPAWEWLQRTLTVEAFKELLPEAAPLEVTRHTLPNLRSLNFTLTGILGAGVASGHRFDPQAKALGEWLRSRHVDIPTALLQTPEPTPAALPGPPVEHPAALPQPPAEPRAALLQTPEPTPAALPGPPASHPAALPQPPAEPRAALPDPPAEPPAAQPQPPAEPPAQGRPVPTTAPEGTP
ncbi:acyclic terpene utilization AtuA family protein [Streptomyces sp. NPDC003952]